MLKNKRFLNAACWTAAALLFTLLIKLVDVRNAGVAGTPLGFAGINTAVHDALGTSSFWYTVSKVLGICAILTALFFAGMGLWQWYRRKSLKEVDRVFFVLAALYVLVVILWKGFDVLALNYRPVLENGVPEPSYPSTHTLLGVVLFCSAVPMIMTYMKRGTLRNILALCAIAAAFLTVLARFLSGVHWFTDIIGGLLISAALLSWFWFFAKQEKRAETA
ncbi:MAG: phosphatase PAP2 family protein [Lachnospiraceae bacterium]|nr:phosphatase PAP2 family protein [Lachnospiraceae bacterium]